MRVLELIGNSYVESFVSENHKGQVINMQFSLDSKNLLTASHDGKARVYDLLKKKLKYSPLSYGFFYAAPLGFSPDGKVFATATGIGVDAVRPVIWDVETGEIKHELSHFSGVMDMMFTPDSKKLITGSRDKTAKIWDVESGNAIQTLNVDDWAAGVGINPKDEDQIYTFSRDRAIYAWSVKTGRYVDGPYQQPLVGHFWYSKIKSNPNLDYIVNIYSMNSISLWPLTETYIFNDNDRDLINKYARSQSRIYQDSDGSLRILPQDDNSDERDISFENNDLSSWLEWRRNDYNTKLYPNGDLSKNWYLDFLVSQDTKDSLEQALILKPADLDIIEKYADKLELLSKSDKVNSQQFRDKAAWYREQLQVTPVSKD